MDAFELQRDLLRGYQSYIGSFIRIQDPRIDERVHADLENGHLWPEPLLQLNPAFESGAPIAQLIAEEVLHPLCADIFKVDKDNADGGDPIRLHRHQEDAIRAARKGENYVLTTGTGSGKSLSYIVPIVDHVLRHGSGRGVQAIIVYPMNALANSQLKELEKFLELGFEKSGPPVRFKMYTGQTSDEDRAEIHANPPDIILTNYVMLELIMTRDGDAKLLQFAQGLKFLVLDELHTYRGRQGADVAMLVRRVRDRLNTPNMQCVGTSATLSSRGTVAERKRAVAEVAERIFGAPVSAESCIGETLRRVTEEVSFVELERSPALSARITNAANISVQARSQLMSDPLAQWVEGFFGLERAPESDRLIRREPTPLRGKGSGVERLVQSTGLDSELIEQALEKLLLEASSLPSEAGQRVFAFRLHQFISKGDTVYASLESPAERYLTLSGQQFVPGSNKEKILLPLCFCRECGQEFYSVSLVADPDAPGRSLAKPRAPHEASGADEEAASGYLFLSDEVTTEGHMLELVPETWLEGGRPSRTHAEKVPRRINVSRLGREDNYGKTCFFIPSPFRFCPSCLVTYDVRAGSDFGTLGTLASEGRSTATTILSLRALHYLRTQSGLKPAAQKLLSFTDNRQDASLQAGHFNDFLQVLILRAALYRAVESAGEKGLTHDQLPEAVFAELGLEFGDYAADPGADKFQARRITNAALLEILSYRLFRDLERGWRINAPNLEQCGLLEIVYPSLDELCREESEWRNAPDVLREATPEQRFQVSRAVLDHLRRELVIKVPCLDVTVQEQMKRRLSDRLNTTFFDPEEPLYHSGIVFPRSAEDSADKSFRYLSGRSAVGKFIRRAFSGEGLNVAAADGVIRALLGVLNGGGFVETVLPERDGRPPGYQVPASAMQWVARDGTKAFVDPVRVPRESSKGRNPNRFFVDLYRGYDSRWKQLRAAEHTAQVGSADRQEREDAFRKGDLPLLYCSPTMELGVDIAELNVVNLRNMPPTPANYAQRSGRAGRSGQPALVFSYCTAGSPHDQYFFQRPKLMVSGAVLPPRIDLANEDLLRSHVYAIWLGESGISLGKSVSEILELGAPDLALPVRDDIRRMLDDLEVRDRAHTRVARVLESLGETLRRAYWYTDTWLADTLSLLPQRFEEACERWRSLYRAARQQQEAQHRVMQDATSTVDDRKKAVFLRSEAEAQINLLTESKNIVQSDFYSYRYFASEGFLPGYNFPRLPLSAFIPGRETKSRQDSYVSRPRFLAISEFGPFSLIYHEGSRYKINRAVIRRASESLGLPLKRAKVCNHCSYLHEIEKDTPGPDLCLMCEGELPAARDNLFRLENVTTRRVARISSDEEERLRRGYDLRTAIRFDQNRSVACREAHVDGADGARLASMTYGDAATIYRLNLGWYGRHRQQDQGFLIDGERGFWDSEGRQENQEVAERIQEWRRQRVVPFVIDTKNALIFRPTDPLDKRVALSLQTALKISIQALYQLEDSELAVEILPAWDDPRAILLYESSEGGAGVLRRLLEEPKSLAEVADKALELCHFNPETGADRRRAAVAHEDCEAACYNCLLSYRNQRFHEYLFRHDILPVLQQLRQSFTSLAVSGTDHVDLDPIEAEWLECVRKSGGIEPLESHVELPNFSARPDFLYRKDFVAVFIHGDDPVRLAREGAARRELESAGFSVVSFRGRDGWHALFERHPSVFGRIAKK